MWNGVTYKKVTAEGLLIERDGKEQLIEVDNIIICETGSVTRVTIFAIAKGQTRDRLAALTSC